MPNVIILRGDSHTSREDRCNEAVTPGHLVEFNANDRIQKHSTSNGKAARMFVLESSWNGGSATTAYVSGDRVPYADCAPGMVVWAHLASGQNVARGDYLSSNGAGLLAAYGGSAPPIAQADEDANASTGIAAAGSLRFRARVV